jgi:cytochrome c
MRRATLKLAAGALAAMTLAMGASPQPDPVRGKGLLDRRCAGCHALDGVKAAPPLRTVYGKPAAGDARYPYSDALRKARFSWDERALDRWLTDPESVVPGNDMSFRLENAAERADIIAYLKDLGSR